MEDTENRMTRKCGGKLYGQLELLASEAIGLAGLFGVQLEYLFANELKTLGGKPFAYIHWYESNQRREREHQEYLKREEIDKGLRKRPYLLDFMREVIKWSEEELNMAMQILQERKTA